MPGKSKNLLRNPCAKAGFDYWEVVCSGGDGFKCEEEPAGCDKICDCTSVKENLPCWSTSHKPCEKFQLVYLPEFDISEERVDEKRPPIRIRDWYGARNDCGCEYTISVRLLADDKSTELDAWKFDDTREEGSGWTKVKHVFQDYPPGVRYVEFKHGGQDTKNWAGHFGAKMTNSGVFVGKKRSNRKKSDTKNWAGHFGAKMTNSGVFVGKKWSNRKKRTVREKQGKNLVKNPCAESNLGGWTIVSDAGWACEKEPTGCKPFKEANEEAEGESCWSTSYQDCEKKQVIDLGFEGYDPDYMDETRPEIRFSEWFGSRCDAGCVYFLTVRLLNSDMETVDEKVIKKTKEAEGDWYKVEDSFGGYGPGVRFIEYSHGGHDTCGWAGNYGAKITCSFVAVVAEADTSSSSSSSSDEN